MRDTAPSSTISTFLKDSIIGMAGKDLSEEHKFPLQTACFTAMIIASHCVGAAYSVSSPSGRILPVPLFGISEQPSNAGKTSVVEDCYAGFAENAINLNRVIATRRDAIKQEIETKKKSGISVSQNELDKLRSMAEIPIGISDPTPEGLESSLVRTGGFFIAYSTEQGLSKTLLGGMYSDGKTKDDLILKAFNAEFHAVERASDRITFKGRPYGGVFELSQEGTINRIMSSAGVSGISERFLMLREGDLLGTRRYVNDLIDINGVLTGIISPTADMIKAHKPVERTALKQYQKQCAYMATKRFENANADVNGLTRLHFDPEAWVVLMAGKQFLEDDIGKQRVRNSYLASMKGKVDLQIMKLAATIHCMDCDIETHKNIPLNIGIETVRTAFWTIYELFEGVSKIADSNAMYGDSAEEDFIMNYLQSQSRPIDMKKICHNIKRQKDSPFRFYTERGAAKIKIEDTIKRLVDEGKVFERKNTQPYLYSA